MSRKQLAVVSNIILTPEQQGMASLLSDSSEGSAVLYLMTKELHR
ncbi:hypothetical protein [Photorhabdus viridis]